MKWILLILALLFAPSAAWAQCSGVFPNNYVCGNVTGSNNTPRATPSSSFPAPPLASITNNTILSNISGSTAVPIGNTLSAILDATMSSSQGSIIYRSGAGWVALASSAGTLTNNGSGGISWGAAGTGTVTSVGPAVSSGLTFTPSPITGAGTIGIDFASAIDLATGTAASKTVNPSIAVLAAAPVALTSSATITPNLNSGYNFSIDQAHSFTLANPSNITGKQGRSFCIVVKNASVPESITFGSSYFAAGGTGSLSLSEIDGALDMICSFIYTTSEIFVFLSKNFTH